MTTSKTESRDSEPVSSGSPVAVLRREELSPLGGEPGVRTGRGGRIVAGHDKPAVVRREAALIAPRERRHHCRAFFVDGAAPFHDVYSAPFAVSLPTGAAVREDSSFSFRSDRSDRKQVFTIGTRRPWTTTLDGFANEPESSPGRSIRSAALIEPLLPGRRFRLSLPSRVSRVVTSQSRNIPTSLKEAKVPSIGKERNPVHGSCPGVRGRAPRPCEEVRKPKLVEVCFIRPGPVVEAIRRSSRQPFSIGRKCQGEMWCGSSRSRARDGRSGSQRAEWPFRDPRRTRRTCRPRTLRIA